MFNSLHFLFPLLFLLLLLLYGVCGEQGSVMCAKFCADSPYSLAVGGHKNGFHIIDVSKLLPGRYIAPQYRLSFLHTVIEASIQHAVFSCFHFLHCSDSEV